MPRTNWPNYQTVRSLIHRHVGRAAVILGGGPSLPKSIERCPGDAIYIGVNDHACRLFADRPKVARPISYVVACDKIEERARADVRPGRGAAWGAPVISRHMWADYRILFMPAPNSGMTAAWFARLLGCAPIILTGMDLYAGSTYHDNPDAKSSGKSLSEMQHFQRWCALEQAYRAQYRVIGCSPLLKKRLGEFDPREVAEPPVSVEKLQKELQGAGVKLTREAMISMRTFQSGQVLELARGEAEKVIRERKAVRAKVPAAA